MGEHDMSHRLVRAVVNIREGASRACRDRRVAGREVDWPGLAVVRGIFVGVLATGVITSGVLLVGVLVVGVLVVGVPPLSAVEVSSTTVESSTVLSAGLGVWMGSTQARNKSIMNSNLPAS